MTAKVYSLVFFLAIFWFFCLYIGFRNQNKIITPVDFFIFGHSHFKNEYKISKESTYFNCGEWINGSSYLEYDSSKFKLIDY